MCSCNEQTTLGYLDADTSWIDMDEIPGWVSPQFGGGGSSDGSTGIVLNWDGGGYSDIAPTGDMTTTTATTTTTQAAPAATVPTQLIAGIDNNTLLIAAIAAIGVVIILK